MDYTGRVGFTRWTVENDLVVRIAASLIIVVLSEFTGFWLSEPDCLDILPLKAVMNQM